MRRLISVLAVATGLSALIAIGGWISSAGPARAQVVGTIVGPGGRAFPIAVSPLKNLSPAGEGAELATRFADALGRDLSLSGMFRVIPADTYIEPPDTSGTTAESINFDNWSVLGAVLLVKGSLIQSGRELTLEARLFDVHQRRHLTGRRYRGEVGDLQRLAHRFADEILRELTGERGPFESRLVFLSTRGGRFKDAYAMSVAGGDLQRITSENTINLTPSWSPDEGSILLTSYRSGAPHLYSVELGSRRWNRLTKLSGLQLGGRWAPDGQRLALSLAQNGNPDIYILAADGSLERRLTDHGAIDVSPSWSPDSRQIAFCSSRSGSPQIYVVSAGGGQPRRITQQGSYNTSPSWSPKGDSIAYVGRVGGRFQIFTVSPEGGEVQQLTRSAGDNEEPSWSPDGRYLVFSSTRTGRAQIYLSDRSGAMQVQLTDGGGNDTSPSWSGWLD